MAIRKKIFNIIRRPEFSGPTVIVGEHEIRIQGSNAALLSLASEPDALKNRQVPSSAQDWRRGWDSNPRYA